MYVPFALLTNNITEDGQVLLSAAALVMIQYVRALFQKCNAKAQLEAKSMQVESLHFIILISQPESVLFIFQ